jgi:hypothetical protein
VPRRLPEEEDERIWDRLNQRVRERADLDPGAYPDQFEAHLEVEPQNLPDEPFLAAIREALAVVGDQAAFFLASEVMRGEDAGLGCEVPWSELTVQVLSDVSQGLECCLYSPSDQWAIYLRGRLLWRQLGLHPGA